MFVYILLFILGLVFLIKGGDWFVDGASSISRRFGLPELLIGATVVSIGTTLPEVMVSAGGAIGGYGGMAYGNSIGSIICNTALIAAITIAVKPGKVDRKTLILPVSFFFVSVAIYVVAAYAIGRFDRWLGVTMLSIFVVYIVVNAIQMKRSASLPDLDTEDGGEEEETKEISDEEYASKTRVGKIMCHVLGKRSSLVRDIVLLVIGAALIAIGADLLVDNGVSIAGELGVPETVIALTFVALGTSLPELVTAITSLIKGHSSLSLGNIIGANLFNIILVSGVAVTISPFDVPNQSQIGGYNASLVFEIPVMLAVMAIMIIPALIRKKLSRVQGISLLVIYAAFCTLQFVLN